MGGSRSAPGAPAAGRWSKRPHALVGGGARRQGQGEHQGGQDGEGSGEPGRPGSAHGFSTGARRDRLRRSAGKVTGSGRARPRGADRRASSNKPPRASKRRACGGRRAMLPCRRWPDPPPKASSASRPSTSRARSRSACYGAAARALAAWREILARLGLLGQDPARYGGAGYGNVSARLGPFGDVPRGRRRFLVTGTQTGGRRRVALADFCVVEEYDLGAQPRAQRGPGRRPRPSRSPTARSTTSPPPRAPCCTRTRPRCGAPRERLGLPVTRADAPQRHARAGARGPAALPREPRCPRSASSSWAGTRTACSPSATSVEEAGAVLLRQLGRALGPEEPR